MYSVVLAAVLTAGSATPATGFGWHSSYGSCYGCSGCYGCYGCCGGCWGSCYGCCGGYYSSCYGCYGCCGGCWGSYYSYSSCYGCYGCHGCCGGTVVYSYPVYSCYGCCGGCHGTVVPAPAVVPDKPKEKLPTPMKSEAPVNTGTVVIAAPAGVQITVNGQAIALKGTEQSFVTPELEPGANYSYMVKASTVREGQTVSQTRKVMIKAGGEARVDFSEFAAAPAPAGSLATR
jgi:uncharacterized protein (TIGR03000 family)